MYKSILLAHAKEDIREAAKWYSKQQKGLGKRFTEEVRNKIQLIKHNPKTANVRYKNVRTAVLNTFPFMIHYTIDSINRTIIIYAVLHTSRSTELWEGKSSEK